MLLAVCLGLTLAMLHALAPHAPAQAALDRRLLYRTHVDAAHIAYENDALAIKVIDGSTPVPADSVHVRLGPDADKTGTEISRIKVPADKRFAFLGEPGTIWWNGPGQLYDDWAPVWAGYGASTFPVEVMRTIYPESLRLEMVRVEGPGDLEVWAGDANYVGRQFSSRDPRLRTQHLTPGGHGHFNWSFSKPGRYQVHWQAHVDLRQGGTMSSPVTAVSWLVGTDSEVGLPPGTTRGAAILHPVEEGSATASASPSSASSAPPSTDSPTTNPQPLPDFTDGVQCVRINEGTVALKASWDGSYEDDGYPTAPKLSAHGPQGPVSSYRGLVELSDSSRVTVPTHQALNSVLPAGSTAWQLPAAPQPGRVSHTFDTTGIDHATLFESDLRWMSVEGPEGSRVALTSGTGESLKVDITSEHYSRQVIRSATGQTLTSSSLWFSQPGLYEVSWSVMIHARKPLANGDTAQNYALYTMWYAVGAEAIQHACANKPAPAPSVTTTPSTPNPSQPTAPTSPALPTDKLVLSKGHVDAFAVSLAGEKLALHLAESVTGHHVLRRPEDVTLRVLPEAERDLPAGQPGAPRAHVLPIVQDHRLLWPGWDTQPVAEGGFRSVRLKVANVTGPGTIHVHSNSTFGGIASVLEGGGTTLPGVISVPFPAHVHANWVLTAPGRYTFEVTALADKEGRVISSNTATYTWVVGAEPDPVPTESGSPFTPRPSSPGAGSSSPGAGSSAAAPGALPSAGTRPTAPTSALPGASSAPATAPSPVSATPSSGAVETPDSSGTPHVTHDSAAGRGLPSTGARSAASAWALGLGAVALTLFLGLARPRRRPQEPAES